MNKLNVKQFKKKLIRGLAYPELFYLPVEDEYEPMIIKILVTEENNEMSIGFYSRYGIRFSYPYYSYLDMDEEYINTNKIQIPPSQGYISFENSSSSYTAYCYYYNLEIKDPSKVLITDDINYFRDKNDCLYKSHDENITDVIYSKFCIKESPCCEIDWGDGTVENCEVCRLDKDDLPFSYDYLKVCKHTYNNIGEYYVKIKGRIPGLNFGETFYTDNNHNNHIELQEIVQWGNLHLYDISNMFQFSKPVKFKMPDHVPPYSFKNVYFAVDTFRYCALDETEFSQEIVFDFVNTFPNLLCADYMFRYTNISYIPKHFCYNHKNIISCSYMFYSSPITHIGERAFANCDNLTTVFELTYNADSFQPLPLLTKVEDGIFENDINLLAIDFAFNYITPSRFYSLKSLYTDESLGLKTVGNNIFKNCKRLRWAFEPFYQQAGLVSVGESLFEGCEDLINVNMCFYRCYSLERIGDNIFKGCTKVRDCDDFCYQDYLVNFPDKMFYDLKYYDYLKGLTDYGNFNGGWENISEQDGQVSYNYDDKKNRLEGFLEYKGYNHNNFPTRKHSKDLFSKEYLIDCVVYGDAIFNGGDFLFKSIIQFTDWKSDGLAGNYITGNYIISNFTGEALPIWEIQGYQELLRNNSYSIFGIRNIKVKWLSTDSHTLVEPEELGYTTNYYDNYMDIAKADPIICSVFPNGGTNFMNGKDNLLDMYYAPSESEGYKVLEFNDPIEYEYLE